MSERTAMTAACSGDTLLGRWQRLQTQVRCALHPRQPERIALYLHCGAKVARRHGGSQADVHLRMLHTLLRTAQDRALPQPWRRACVTHAELLAPCVLALLRWQDAAAARSLEASLEQTRDGLCDPRVRLG